MESKATVSNEAINLPALCTRSSVEELGASNARVARSNRAGCPTSLTPSSIGKDTGLSRREGEFNSRWRHHDLVAQMEEQSPPKR